MNKPKARGTAFESWLVKVINEWTPHRNAKRIAEGGMNDRGDIEFMDGFNQKWVVEAKAREVLNVTRELGKARKKGGEHTVLAWKRLVKGKGNRRSPDGEPVVVVLSLESWLELIKRENL